MSLDSGSQLGPYRIVGALGAGGMGEVYRATDTRLDRTVAIKVLPGHVADDPMQRERFEREARAIAALNHRNICTLHDIGHAQPSRPPGAAGNDTATTRENRPVDFLVMEFLEGETLRQRLEVGMLPFDEAVSIASEIAEALDVAHQQGIIHRDLKPGNVMLTASGVKLLDFGLARLREPESQEASLAAPTRAALTTERTILGTLQYMSPEQLEGRTADARSDIFAFGATLYEMLTGLRPFDGKSQASIIGSILKDEPRPLREVQPRFPRLLDRLVRTCLAKAPDDRWQTVRDLKRELRWIADANEADETAVAAPWGASPRPPRGWVTASLVATAVVTALAVWLLKPIPAPLAAPVHRFTIEVGPNQELTRALAVSPDGRHVVYGATGDGTTRLFARALDAFESMPIAGTEGALTADFSPDSQHLVFQLSDDERWSLNRVPLAGGVPYTILDGDGALDQAMVWLDDDTIVYTALGDGHGNGLMQVPATGGQPRILTVPDARREEYAHIWPVAVPDRGEIIFTIVREQPVQMTQQDSTVAIYSPVSGDAEVLLEEAVGLGYVQSGFLLYGDRSSLMAVGIDLDTSITTGTPVPLFFDSAGDDVVGNAISETGTLAYIVNPSGTSALKQVHVVVNWYEELRSLLSPE